MKLATYRSGRSTAIGIVDAGTARIFDLATAARRDGAWTRSSPRCWRLSTPTTKASISRARCSPSVAARRTCGWRSPTSNCWRPCRNRGRCAMRCRSNDTSASRRAGCGLWRRARRAARRRSARRWRRRSAKLASIYRQMPIYYITNRFSVVGPDATVRWPRYSEVMDYELEIAIVTRRTRANIPADEAAAHIFGYTIFNDFSARDRQRVEMAGRLGPAKGKSFDGGECAGALDRHAGRTRRSADA